MSSKTKKSSSTHSSLECLFPLIFPFFSNRDTGRGVCYDIVGFHVSAEERNCLASQKRQHTLPLTTGEARACVIAIAAYARSQTSHSDIARAKRASKRNTVCPRTHRMSVTGPTLWLIQLNRNTLSLYTASFNGRF
jgi:hypothetical protein